MPFAGVAGLVVDLRPRLVASSLAVLVVTGPQNDAWARGPHWVVGPATPDDDAGIKFDRAEELYRDGRYDEAIEILSELIDEYGEPILYFNLGRAQESSGRIEDAIETYEQYLALAPDAPDHTAVEGRIERLRERARAAQEPVPPPQPEPQSPPSEAPPPPIVAPWVLAGLGGASLGVGAVFGGLSRSRTNAAADAQSQVDVAEHADAATRHALAANVAFGIGGALAVAGLSWGIAAVIGRRRTNRQARALVSPTGLTIAWRW